MKTIHVKASTEYNVYIGRGLLANAGEMIRQVTTANRAVIVSDDHVFPLYGTAVKQALEEQDIRVSEFIFPHGENSKCLEIYGQILEYLSECRLTRSDFLVALGGGVTGDMTGFAAATYQRGIKYVQIPTTLLAAVDSSVGGKTAVNLKSGKNQVGCFYQPSMVICDIDTLDTLPEQEFINGSAEVIKYGMIGDAQFLQQLATRDIREWPEDVIAKCVEMKRDVVAQDEFDTGLRMLLNFGHTLGHGVEKCSDYSIPHGFAVAQGMAEITRSAQLKGICPEGTYESLMKLLEKYSLPVKITYPAQAIIDAAGADKKNAGRKLRIIIPEEAGRCVVKEIEGKDLAQWCFL